MRLLIGFGLSVVFLVGVLASFAVPVSASGWTRDDCPLTQETYNSWGVVVGKLQGYWPSNQNNKYGCVYDNYFPQEIKYSPVAEAFYHPDMDREGACDSGGYSWSVNPWKLNRWHDFDDRWHQEIWPEMCDSLAGSQQPELPEPDFEFKEDASSDMVMLDAGWICHEPCEFEYLPPDYEDLLLLYGDVDGYMGFTKLQQPPFDEQNLAGASFSRDLLDDTGEKIGECWNFSTVVYDQWSSVVAGVTYWMIEWCAEDQLMDINDPNYNYDDPWYNPSRRAAFGHYQHPDQGPTDIGYQGYDPETNSFFDAGWIQEAGGEVVERFVAIFRHDWFGN